MTKLNTINQPTWALEVLTDENGNEYYGDMYTDSNNNIVIIKDVNSVAQTFANELSLWQGEYEYDITIGLPYANLLGDVFNQLLFYDYIKNVAQNVNFITNLNDVKFNRDREKRITKITVDYDTVDTKGRVTSVAI